jgi:hypothetical protein
MSAFILRYSNVVTRKSLQRFTLFILFLFISPFSTRLVAQLVTASVRGTVVDASGAALANADVSIRNTSTSLTASAVTDSHGFFVFTSLTPGGPYTISVQEPGFKIEERNGINLALNQVVDLTIPLQVGSEDQKVEVTSDATQLEVATATMGQVIENRAVDNLPLNQRNVYSLMFLVPGVTGSVTAQYNSLNFSVNGGRPGTTNVLVDGIPASPPLIVPIGGFAVFPSVDAVQEFKVQTNAYPAEFGRSGSGIVNVILKQGTNKLHGSIYDFVRNSSLDANSFFANRNKTPLPSFSRNQFGGSVSGPVILSKLYDGRDKTFFMFSYEGLRQNTFNELTTTVPTELQKAGDFSQTFDSTGKPVIIYDPTTTIGATRQPFANNRITSIDPVAAKILGYYPKATSDGDPGTHFNNFYGSGVAKLNVDTMDTRIDQIISPKDRFFVSYSRRNLTQPPVLFFPAEQQIAQGGSSQPQLSNSAAIDYSHVFGPTWLVDIPVGFSRTFIDFKPISAGFNPSTELGFPGYIASNADHLLFPGISATNYYTLGDAGQGVTRRGGFNIYYFGSNLTKVLGQHVIKFGGEFRVLQANDSESGASTGTFGFTNAITQGPNPNVATSTGGNAIASLLLGVGSSGSYTINSKNAATTSKYYGAYLQDDWKAGRNLTLNLGLRYDLDVPRTERYNRAENFDPNAVSPLASLPGLTGVRGGTVFVGTDGSSRRQFNPQYANFGPRFGFAYQLNSFTVVRGAYGVYFGPSIRSAYATVGSQGFSATTTYTGSADGLTPSVYLSNPFPNGLNQPSGNSLGLLTGLGSSFSNPLQGDNKVGYTENYDFGIQHQLPWSVLVEAAWVGSHGVHQTRSAEGDYNANQLPSSVLAQGTALQTKVANPFYGTITTGVEAGATIPRSYLLAPYPQYVALNLSYLGGGYSDYNSLQLKLSKRLSHGLSTLVSYTGQKQIDNYSGIQNVGNITGGIQDIYNPAAERAVSSNNINRVLVISGVYTLPIGRKQRFGSDWNRPLDLLLGGWQINGITTQQTGFPLSPATQNTSNSGSNVLRPNLVAGVNPSAPAPVKSAATLTGYVNKAAFTQPAAYTFGNAPRTLANARGPGTHNVDLSVFKNFNVADRAQLEVRAEAFNLLNQVVFGLPNMSYSGAFGSITSQANSPRQIQLALKATF